MGPRVRKGVAASVIRALTCVIPANAGTQGCRLRAGSSWVPDILLTQNSGMTDSASAQILIIVRSKRGSVLRFL